VTGRAAYPGTFNPLTIAHLGVAEAARRHPDVDHVDLVVSRNPLGKSPPPRPCLDHRVEVLRRAASTRPWLGVVVTDAQLLADIAAGYDTVVMGADKWSQIQDPEFYDGSTGRRDAAIARLPRVLLIPRPPHPVPGGAEQLVVDTELAPVSSTAVLGGRRDWMAPEAIAFDDETGAWSDPDRYAGWCRS
jgi:nicotinate-nucleotide adenylyltransferase